VSKIDYIAGVISGIGAVIIFGLFAISGLRANNVQGAESYICSQKVIVIDKGIAQEKESFNQDLESFLNETKIVVYPEDKITLSVPFNLCLGEILTIDRAPVIYLTLGNEKKIIRSFKKTVKDVLPEKNISLGSKDKITPSLSSEISNQMSIIIVRIGERIEKEKLAIDYDVEERPDSNLVIGKTAILQEGIEGEKEVTLRITSENGVDVKKEVISETILRQPQKRIITYGTKPPTTYLAIGQAKWYTVDSAMIGACNLVSKGTPLLVTNLDNGRSVRVTASGGGAFGFPIIIDLSTSAFEALGGNLWQGILRNVKVEQINE